jgi:hypothetical protein
MAASISSSVAISTHFLTTATFAVAMHKCKGLLWNKVTQIHHTTTGKSDLALDSLGAAEERI